MPQAKNKLPPELEEAVRLQIANPLIFFTPTGKQEDFLKRTDFIQGFSGGNWSGKTTTLIAKTAAFVWNYPHNPFLAPLYKEAWPRPIRGRWFSPHTVVQTDLIPQLRAWLPRSHTTAMKAGRPFESHWKLYDQNKVDRKTHNLVAEFDILTYDQAPEEAEGVKLDWAAFNEPPPEPLFNATVARMKPHGVILMGMTPLSGAGYLYDRLERREGKSNWHFVYADIESACIEHGVRGYLPHDAIQKKIDEYDPDEREARIAGKPMHLSGVVYKEWAREREGSPWHLIDDIDIPRDWTRYQIVDPHDRRPYACIWWAVDPQGHHYVYDEFPHEVYRDLKNNPYRPNDYKEIFLNKEEQTGGSPRTRIMDARFGPKADGQTGSSLIETFDELGIIFDTSYKDSGGAIEIGHQAVRELLSECQCGAGKPHPRLRVLKKCRNMTYAMEHYCWDDFRKTDGRAPKEKPKDEHKDFADCIRYGAMEDPVHMEDPQPERAETSTQRWVRERQMETADA